MPSKRQLAVFAAIIVVTAGTVIFARGASDRQPAVVAPVSRTLVSGPGRVEPSTEDIKLGSELSGKLKKVYVEEGDNVHAGQVLAELENADYRAQVASAEAEVAAKEATLRKVVNGARSQERSQALSTVRETEAVMNNANAEMERRQKLFAAGVISREEADRYAREYEVARARYQEAKEYHSLVDDRAREEDQAFAEADLKLARAHLEEARAKFAKTLIKSPIDGTVLRKHHKDGESVSNSSTVPDPIVTVGDKNVIRVRVDIDETEVSKIRVGQTAYVRADAFGDRKFPGRVIRVGQQLGKKNVFTDEPTEHVDNKILETLVELEPGAPLPMGLRVDAYIETR